MIEKLDFPCYSLVHRSIKDKINEIIEYLNYQNQKGGKPNGNVI